MRPTIWAGALAASLIVGAGMGPVAAASPASTYLQSVVKTKTAVWTLIASKTSSNGGENYDGYSKGAMVVTVPLGWTVKMVFKNQGELPHSVVVEPWKENYNSPTPKAAFKGAETTNPVDGTAPGSSQTVSFKATKAGEYRVVCAVPGHGALGMWDTLFVQKGLKAPIWGKPKASSSATAKTVKSKFLTSIPAHQMAVLTLLGGQGGDNGGENFDGYANGKMTITVPLGWTVSVKFKNVGNLPHSVIVEPYSESYSSQSPKPAFKGAESLSPLDGTAPGSSSNFTFKASKAGKYRIICGVPGHAALGMWDTLIVQKGASEASVHV